MIESALFGTEFYILLCFVLEPLKIPVKRAEACKSTYVMNSAMDRQKDNHNSLVFAFHIFFIIFL